jgi:hypothetical protein
MKSFNLVFNLLIFSLLVLSIVLLLDVQVKYSKWMMSFLILSISIMFFLKAILTRNKGDQKKEQ